VTRGEELIRRFGDAPPLVGERELTRLARTAASTERVPPRASGARRTRATAAAATLAVIASAGLAASVHGWTGGSARPTGAVGAAAPQVQFDAVLLLTEHR
jgi:hypothetical protein